MRKTRILGIITTVVAGASALPAQQKFTLGKPDAETTESFTRIASIRELPSGKVLIADPQDKIVQMVDLVSGSVSKVGREGGGPGEYALPQSLLALPDGSTLVMDMLNRRFLTITPEGKPGTFLEFPRPPAQNGGGGPVMMIGGMDTRGTDNKGWVYLQGMPFPRPGEPASDSAPIMKWDRIRPKYDTIGYVKLATGSVQTSGGAGRFEVRMGAQKVFTPAESWTVTGDGRIARVTPSPYRVIWLDAQGKQTIGPVQPYTPIKVTEADKEQEREARRRSRPMMITMGPGGRSAGPAPVGQLPELEFEETMPPFVAGAGRGGSVLGTPDGEVWVLRTRPASDKSPSYDVFDRAGVLIKKVTLNPNSRVAGFGNGTVYVVRFDEDDLQYLQRYKKP